MEYNEVLELGDYVKDVVTGFEGFVVTRMSFLTGCDMYRVQSATDTTKDELINVVRLKRVVPSEPAIADRQKEMEEMLGKFNKSMDIHNAKYDFGDKLTDIVSGYSGVCIAIGIEISGDIAYSISNNVAAQNNTKRDDIYSTWFDEGRCRLEGRIEGVSRSIKLNKEKEEEYEKAANVDKKKKTGGIFGGSKNIY